MTDLDHLVLDKEATSRLYLRGYLARSTYVAVMAKIVLAARDMGSRVAAPVEPQPREEHSPSTQGRGVNKP